VFSLVSQFGLAGRFLWPGVAAALGIGLVWQQADSAQRHRWRSVATGSASFWVALLRFVVGAALIALGLVGFLATQGQLARARAGLLSTAVVVAGLVLLAGPWVARLARDLGAERRARIRAQERAEVAAQVHDSVLHTLALIQRNAADPHTVGRLARAEERSLRNWLYQRNGKADAHLRNALERLAGEVEELHGVPVNLVAVGDARLDDRLLALVQATREAVVNAAKSSGANSVSVYAETERDRATVFVRDRGCGFDPAEVPADRHGISGSIVGRMTRSGGTALVRSVPGEGTEVELAMPLGARRANR
jgi:signal transduction histidine kinase